MNLISSALNDFYFSTSGSSWINNSNWLNYNKSYSEWYGITVNENNDIVSLVLSDNNLHGTLTTTLAYITTLKEISVTSNYLSGSLPAELLELQNLEKFSVRNNMLTGSVKDICFRTLLYLEISDNYLIGDIPECLSNMGNLYYAGLAYNYFSGSIPKSFSYLTNIEDLNLNFNVLSGTIPLNFSSLVKVKFIDLSSNLLRGQLNNRFCNWENLTNFAIQDNVFTGPFPHCIFSMSSIYSVHASDNFLSGTLPHIYRYNLSIFQVKQNLLTGTTSVLSKDDYKIVNNYFTGSVPPVMNVLNYHISYNYFSGSLLNTSFGTCADLQLDHNYIYGTLPCLEDQVVVYLQYNLLTGSISNNSWLAIGYSINVLVYLRLDNNFLTGQISSQFSITNKSHPYFHTLILSNNYFTGFLDEKICSINFFNFQISNNLLTGPSCNDFTFWTGYNNFGISYSLSDNKFTGSILDYFNNCPSLYKIGVIDLSINHFTGELNNFNFNEAQRLLQFELGYNVFSGTIPERVMNMTSLTSFSLGGNLLSGTIPTSFSLFTDLKLLDITGLQMCYSIDLARAVLGYSSGDLYRCQDMQDIAICSLRYQSSIYDTISSTDNELSLFYESKHLYEPDTDVYEYISVPNAYYFTIVFDDWSELETDFAETDYIQFCGDDRCLVKYGSVYEGKLFPGIHGMDPLIINSDNFYIHFHTDAAVQYWGYAFTATAVIPRIGWICGSPPNLSLPFSIDFLESYNLTLNNSYAIDFCGNYDQWEGITCTYGMVQKLSFGSYGIHGTIPSVISLLTYLENIDFKYNSLSGLIPSSIGDLTSLRFLDISNNQITGSIPDSIGYLSNIEEIYLFSNKLSGLLPESFCYLNKTLEKLYLSANQLTGKLESSLCSLKNSTIDISGNSLSCYESCWSSAISLKSNIQECYPTNYPTSLPSAPTINPTRVTNISLTYKYYGLMSAFGAVTLAVCIFLFYWWTKSNERKEKFVRNSILDKLPIHRYIINNEPSDFILQMIRYSYQTISKRDYEGNQVIDLVINYDYNNEIVSEILKQLLLNENVINKDFIYAWTRIVQFDKYLESVQFILDEFHQFNRQLSDCLDENGREAVNIASPLCRKAIKESLYFLRRYDFGSHSYPTHVSETSIVYIVLDTQGDIMGNNKVALKFISDKDCYKKEIESRITLSSVDSNIINILESYDSEYNLQYELDINRWKLSKYLYCIVMPACEKSLGNIIVTERIAGKDWNQLQSITSKLAIGIKELHNKGYIHGDIKPLNVVRMGNDIKLIDLDSCMKIGFECDYTKFSQAYISPEMLFIDKESNSICFKTLSNQMLGKSFELLKADYSQDSWALGMLLYELYTGMSFFPKDDEDRIDEESINMLYDFKDEIKTKKLLKISDKLARNLVSLLLIKEPSKRLSIQRVLEHPFITNKTSPRLIGEDAEYDVFLSYRVNADLDHAQLIYDLLTSEGIKVWWDKKSLLPGMNWENGFSDGLVKSKVIAPIISKHSLNHPSDYRSNITYLHENSPCDNVLLEYEMALECQERGLVSYIYPILIGEYDYKKDEYLDYFICGSYPKGVKNCEVKSIDEKVQSHLNRLGLGSRMITNDGIKTVLDKILKSQGIIIKGFKQNAFQPIVNDMKFMIFK